MFKKLVSLAIAVLMLAAMAIPALAADVTVMTTPTESDYTFLRGYSGDKGSHSTTANRLNLNGTGVVSTANKIVWDPNLFTGEAGIVFTVTYNEAYTSLSDSNTDANYFENYRFAVALMDSQNFQGNADGNGLGVEFRLCNKTGGIKAMGLYYDGEKDLGIKYPNRNKTTAMSATASRAVKCKITWNSGNQGLWKIWIDNDGDGTIDSLVAAFNPAEKWEVDNNNVGQYFPTNLLSGGQGFLVFGSYTSTATNMSISIDQLYGGFMFGDKVAAPTAESASAAYTVGDKYVQFIQADDSKFVTADADGSWTVADKAGAIGGKAIYGEKTATSADGSGFTLKFYAPKEADYAIWGRVFFEDQLKNSMFYKVDKGTQNIWDLPDEDVVSGQDAPDCYGNWQYFYLTHRKAGTYSAADGYGTYTVQYGDWRHAPNVLHLAEGWHEIKITGREAGVYIDEFVITNYTIDEYDPNEFTGNDKLLDVCKFCGEDAHYYSDVLAQKGESAQSYFVRVLNTDAKKYELPIVTPDGSGDNNNDDGGAGNNNQTQDPAPSDKDDKDDETEAPATDTKAEETTSADTEAEKGGCGSAIGIQGIGLLVAIVAVAGVFGTKKRKVR